MLSGSLKTIASPRHADGLAAETSPPRTKGRAHEYIMKDHLTAGRYD